MAITDYTDNELKRFVLGKINGIKGISPDFSASDSTESFNSAVRECGFGIPAATEDDRDRAKKYHWIIERMKYWFLDLLLIRYSLEFDKGELKADGIKKGLIKILAGMDKKFKDAQSDPINAALFLDASDVFGSDLLVIPTGFIEDRIGQMTDTETEDRTE